MRRRKDNGSYKNDWLLQAGEEPAIEAQIVTPREVYNQHGI